MKPNDRPSSRLRLRHRMLETHRMPRDGAAAWICRLAVAQWPLAPKTSGSDGAFAVPNDVATLTWKRFGRIKIECPGGGGFGIMNDTAYERAQTLWPFSSSPSSSLFFLCFGSERSFFSCFTRLSRRTGHRHVEFRKLAHTHLCILLSHPPFLWLSRFQSQILLFILCATRDAAGV